MLSMVFYDFSVFFLINMLSIFSLIICQYTINTKILHLDFVFRNYYGKILSFRQRFKIVKHMNYEYIYIYNVAFCREITKLSQALGLG